MSIKFRKGFATPLFMLIMTVITCILLSLINIIQINHHVNIHHQEVSILQNIELIAIKMIRGNHELPIMIEEGNNSLHIEKYQDEYFITIQVNKRILKSLLKIIDNEIIYEYIE